MLLNTPLKGLKSMKAIDFCEIIEEVKKMCTF